MGFAMATRPGITDPGYKRRATWNSPLPVRRNSVILFFLPIRNKIKNRVARRRRGRALLAGTACALSNLAKEFSNASRDFNFNLSHRYLRNHARRSHIADAHCLQRTGPLPTTRRTGESRELEGVAHWTTDCSGGPGDGRNALPLFHARNRYP